MKYKDYIKVRKHNKHLTDFSELKDSVISNSLKKIAKNNKINKSNQIILSWFERG